MVIETKQLVVHTTTVPRERTVGLSFISFQPQNMLQSKE